MTTTEDFDRRAMAWLADGPTELNDRVLGAALREVHSTHQRRAARVPWRFPSMLPLGRVAGLSTVVLVAAVGVAALLQLPGIGPAASGQTTPNTATEAPSTRLSPSAPGIDGWQTFNSTTYDFDMAVPSDWSSAPAARPWESADRFPVDGLPYADKFFSPGESDDVIGLFAWEVPPGDGADIESFPGLSAWADRFCREVITTRCDEFTPGTTFLCLASDVGPCMPAIRVTTFDVQYAFFMGKPIANVYGMGIDPTVRVVVVARPDGFPAAARYGGSVRLLTSILETMNVHLIGPD